MNADVIELMAKAIWNTNPTYINMKYVLGTDTVGTYYPRSFPVLWDDEDILETDRELFRLKTCAALAVLTKHLREEAERLPAAFQGTDGNIQTNANRERALDAAASIAALVEGKERIKAERAQATLHMAAQGTPR